VLRLRAYQMRLFEHAVARWAVSGQESGDLLELGGPFPGMLRRNAWWIASERRLLVDRSALRVLFKQRSNPIPAFPAGAPAPTLDESRALYAFLLRHPIPSPAAFAEPDPSTAPLARRANEDAYRLKKIDELAAIDPLYPRALARGIVHFRQGRF